jgi:two-component system response regulator VanR
MSSILIIDDDISVLDLIRQSLVKFGYQVETAENGRDGMRRFSNSIFDLVITDFMMPDVKGDDVLRHVRATQKQYTPVICISGTPWLPETCNFDTVLTKPFTLKVLIEAVKNLV